MTNTLLDPQGQPYPHEVQVMVATLEAGIGDLGPTAQRLVMAALESVRGKQADVCMEDPENILYFEAGSENTTYLMNLAKQAKDGHHSLRVAIDHGALKVKVGSLSWSAPMRSERENGGYPR